ncbi:MAG: pyridoxamine 5'-phosphate oxidase [Pelagibacteraceae bacterium]|jgi:pyridoxamine 5'-phosphate oxidase|nr:pyridoxamine 5'-phosphate oxidase [Pelagibacteraceae bacterium]MDP6710296.1 pyridoxamine 5'-phosphate oxidase [Pelagibacteraceae bacterium]
MNQKNSLGLNSCFTDLNDPIELFKLWIAEADKNEIKDPNASSLATANNAGEPDVRIILLKEINSKGFVFYTNLNSPKSQDLKKNPKAAMCFYWKSINRQVKILGNVIQVDDEEADHYFKSRPYGSRIGAWASDQSNVMKSTSEILKKIENLQKKYKNEKEIPRPPFWSGWQLEPLSIEFWLRGENRIHERLRYKKVDSGWKKEILYP